MRAALVLTSTLAIALAGCSGDDNANSANVGNGDFGNEGQAGNTGQSGDGNPFAGNLGLGPGSSNGCAQGMARASRVVPRVILVIDGSCSMSTNYPSSGGPSATMCRNNGSSRWSALRNALLDPQNGVVRRLEGAIEFGLVVFGTQPECPLTGTPIQPALNNAAAIDGAIAQVPPGLYTPTGAALDWVYDNMIRGQQLDTNAGPEIVILATDGEPNSCGDANTNYRPSIDALNKGRSKNVTTYVISLAASSGQFHDHLQELADIGAGTAGAELYEPTTPEELAADLELLIGGAVNCDLALNGRISLGSECQGTVTLNGQALGCNDPNGWALIDTRHIRVQGTACELLKSSPDALLEARFPCGTFNPD